MANVVKMRQNGGSAKLCARGKIDIPLYLVFLVEMGAAINYATLQRTKLIGKMSDACV